MPMPFKIRQLASCATVRTTRRRLRSAPIVTATLFHVWMGRASGPLSLNILAVVKHCCCCLKTISCPSIFLTRRSSCFGITADPACPRNDVSLVKFPGRFTSCTSTSNIDRKTSSGNTCVTPCVLLRTSFVSRLTSEDKG